MISNNVFIMTVDDYAKFNVIFRMFCSHKSFEFSKDQVRILLFRECERRGRKLLFDSKAVKRIPCTNVPQNSRARRAGKTEGITKAENFVEISSGFGYQVCN